MPEKKTFIKSLNHVAFNVTKYDEMVDFYVNTLGLKNKFSLNDNDGNLWLTYIEIGDHQYLELFPVPKDQVNYVQGKAKQAQHICLIVEDITAVAEDLKSKGVQLWNGPSYLGNKSAEPFVPQMGKAHAYAFYITDPENNEIEIMQFTKDSLQIQD